MTQDVAGSKDNHLIVSRSPSGEHRHSLISFHIDVRYDRGCPWQSERSDPSTSAGTVLGQNDCLQLYTICLICFLEKITSNFLIEHPTLLHL